MVAGYSESFEEYFYILLISELGFKLVINKLSIFNE